MVNNNATTSRNYKNRHNILGSATLPFKYSILQHLMVTGSSPTRPEPPQSINNIVTCML